MLRFSGPHPTGYVLVFVIGVVLVIGATYAIERWWQP